MCFLRSGSSGGEVSNGSSMSSASEGGSEGAGGPFKPFVTTSLVSGLTRCSNLPLSREMGTDTPGEIHTLKTTYHGCCGRDPDAALGDARKTKIAVRPTEGDVDPYL